jgi:hypothetical protein
MPEPSPFNTTSLPSFGGSSTPSGGAMSTFMGAMQRFMPTTQDGMRAKKSGSRTPAPPAGVPAATGGFNRPQNADQRLALIQAMAQRARGRPVTGA